MADFVLPSQLSSKLDAVNVLLASINEAPITTLDSPAQSPDAEMAEATLDEIHRTELGKGWWFNREDAMVLAPDNLGNIALPNNTLNITRAYGYSPSGNIAERARQLYDVNNHTLIFTDAVTVDLIIFLEFEEVPEVFRRWVTIASAQLFHGRVQSSRIVLGVQQPYADRAQVILEQAEDSNRPKNAIYGNVDTVNKLFGRGVRRR